MVQTVVFKNDKLLEDARLLTGIEETGDLLEMALTKLIERENVRNLIALGGSQPGFRAAPRRRPPDFINPDVDDA
jgi:hypothetical protein